MRARRFGSAGPSVPVLGIGTWNMEQDPRKAAIAAIRRAIELGMVHVDTAVARPANAMTQRDRSGLPAAQQGGATWREEIPVG